MDFWKKSSNCARAVTEALQAVSGVSRSVVDLGGATARTYWLPEQIPDPARLIAAVKQAGYRAFLHEIPGSQDPASSGGSSSRSSAGNPWSTAVWLGAPASALLLGGDWIGGWGMHRWFQTLSLVLATAVQAGVGWRFYRGAWRQARVGRSNMDTLVALGTLAAFSLSLF